MRIYGRAVTIGPSRHATPRTRGLDSTFRVFSRAPAAVRQKPKPHLPILVIRKPETYHNSEAETCNLQPTHPPFTRTVRPSVRGSGLSGPVRGTHGSPRHLSRGGRLVARKPNFAFGGRYGTLNCRFWPSLCAIKRLQAGCSCTEASSMAHHQWVLVPA